MWWAIDEDWATSSGGSAKKRQDRRVTVNQEKKREIKGKRSCTRKDLQTGNLAAAPNATAEYMTATSTIPSAVSSGMLSPIPAWPSSNSSVGAGSSNGNTATVPASGSNATAAPHDPSNNISSANATSVPAARSSATPTSSSSFTPSNSSSMSTSSASSSVSSLSPPPTVTIDSSNPFANTNPHATTDIDSPVDGIDVKIGRSLVQVSKEGFEKYSQEGLDKSENVLSFPSSSKFGFISRWARPPRYSIQRGIR